MCIKLSQFSDEGTTEMEIKSAKASDSAQWACLDDEGQFLDFVQLLVIPRFASGPFLFQMGNILSNSSVISAKEGEILQLICVGRQPKDLHFDLNGRSVRGHKTLAHLIEEPNSHCKKKPLFPGLLSFQGQITL